MVSPEAVSDCAGEVRETRSSGVTMTRAAKGARSWRECRAHRSFRRRWADNGAHGHGPEIPRGAPQGERPRRRERRTPRRKLGLFALLAQIDRTPGPPVVRNERKASLWPRGGSREASACRSWHADLGASQASKRHRRSARPSSGVGEKEEKRKGRRRGRWQGADRERDER